ncbi:MAG: c-type cytochrome [Armatimonadetes bacterium]|nr:c-type cytochrome [Armatimonadota bacterium]
MANPSTLTAEEPHLHAAHATNKTYVNIAIILAVITAVEIGAIYLPWPDVVKFVLLGILSIAKFAMVCMFFMHLYFDSRLLTFLFAAGLVLGVLTTLTLKALMYVPSLSPPPKPAAVALKPPDAKRGMVVFETVGCTACHFTKDVPGQAIGPELDGIGTRGATRIKGMDAKAYVEQSIESPQAFIVTGFEDKAQMANLRGNMDDQEYADLVTYLISLK